MILPDGATPKPDGIFGKDKIAVPLLDTDDTNSTGARHRADTRGKYPGRIKTGITTDGRPEMTPVPVQKRLRTFSAQFHDFRPVRAQIIAA